MNQAFKRTIITKPVINSLDELSAEDKYTTFISKCYGCWKRNDDGGYSFSYDNEHRKVVPKRNNTKTHNISPSHTRLDVFMKNEVIRKHFEKEGFATEWKEGNMILHPEILAHEYAGEIGEEAFKALLLHYSNLKESQIKHLEGKQYELADFVILNHDGSYRIAFDVKNYKDNNNDTDSKYSIKEKRDFKRNKLGCDLIIINMLDLGIESTDIHEICGLIDKEGRIDPNSINKLCKLVNN